LLDQIIPVLDNFDSAFSGSAWENVDSNWRIGIEYIYNQFVKILEENDVVAFGEAGEEFDENIHHSVEIEENEDREKSGKISKVLMRGYKIKDRIVREAKVKIYK
jgi:molecular chaperone GrpE